MENLGAGKEIDAYCTRCRLDLAHTIIAVVGNQIGRVICNTCNSQHKYYPPKTLNRKPGYVRRRTVVKQRNGKKITISSTRMKKSTASLYDEEKRKPSKKKAKQSASVFNDTQWRLEVLNQDVDNPPLYRPLFPLTYTWARWLNARTSFRQTLG